MVPGCWLPRGDRALEALNLGECGWRGGMGARGGWIPSWGLLFWCGCWYPYVCDLEIDGGNCDRYVCILLYSTKDQYSIPYNNISMIDMILEIDGWRSMTLIIGWWLKKKLPPTPSQPDSTRLEPTIHPFAWKDRLSTHVSCRYQNRPHLQRIPPWCIQSINLIWFDLISNRLL